MRMTKNKRLILDALRPPTDPDIIRERGMAPYSASCIALDLGLDHRNVARTLRNMAKDGLVVPETCWRQVWAEGLKSTQGRSGFVRKQLTCYWRADTQVIDRQSVDDWNAGAEERQRKAVERFAVFVTGRAAQP